VKKVEVIQYLLGKQYLQAPQNNNGSAFAPTNIALCKYWGKRNQELILPVTSSLSISLGSKGAKTKLELINATHDEIILNNVPVNMEASFRKRLIDFLNLFRGENHKFKITLESNIPIAAGLASSAAGFASITKALDSIMGWHLSPENLSIIARMGSGSASRSLWQGFVEWHAGTRDDGMDSIGEPLNEIWDDFNLGLLIFSEEEKVLSSRTAMQRTVTTSAFYAAWPAKVAQDLTAIKAAIHARDFPLLGQTAESNALSMHATMLSAWPPILYSSVETWQAMQKIWELRANGLEIYFTQDAGPNLKLLFLKKDAATVQAHFPGAEILQPFKKLLPTE
jgi:diphosphomevalonate decarboxylase